jgi:monothiol glutaredoxin
MALEPATRDRIQSLIDSGPVVLFMKGDPMAPRCGFSAQVVRILDSLVSEYVTCDVLEDPEIREGVKQFSSWPTVPQLYVKGKFVGGCDIVTEMAQSGELEKALSG